MEAQKIDELRDQLLAMRDELRDVVRREKEQLGQQLKPGEAGEAHLDFNHPADMVGTDPDYRKEINLVERELGELFEVNAALERIAEGSYGTCEECGAGIRFARLKAVPYTRHCVDCQEILDRKRTRPDY